ncbi:MAG: hypothetical protein CSA09_04525 [Candidatus Contendobacter odensis]|uniref:Phosphoribosyltransferase n=1 Tax=Candidatus Contendibacter odensensis TaxID=1400860 RepID=A0A2G6PE35_9GAMM|nr:MAG: hypothetical protein CSA09_04525 [Candidatus Contendobacter odensis]
METDQLALRCLTVPIQAGQLKITIRREGLPLADCLDFATRQNPRRLFLFVSKVLGKHWAVKPRTMQKIHSLLAARIADLPGPVLVVGMAETATALGRGVAEEVALQSRRNDILYLQTTRYHLSRPLALGFDESHSHAPDHRVYLPELALQPLFYSARTLVLVDDEISTGRTLAELAQGYFQVNSQVEQLVFASITNWLPASRQQELAELLVCPLQFPALIEGEFTFEADPLFPLPSLPVVVADRARNHDAVVTDPARIGVIAGQWQLPALPPVPDDQSLTIIGTGEYAYTPFRVALALEEQGRDVRFQSTTRSPILIGDAITDRHEFLDNYGDGIPNYLYNLDPERLPVVIYEHADMLDTHLLPNLIKGLAFAVEESCHVS